MRTALASAPTFTDAAGNNEKARALSAWLRQGQRAVVNFGFKPTGASADNTRASLTPTHPRERTHEAGKHIVASFTRQRKNGADNEHSAYRKTDTNHRRADGRAFDAIRLASL